MPADRLAVAKDCHLVGPRRQLARCILPERNSQVPSSVSSGGRRAILSDFPGFFFVKKCVLWGIFHNFPSARITEGSRKRGKAFLPPPTAAVCVCERVFSLPVCPQFSPWKEDRRVPF